MERKINRIKLFVKDTPNAINMQKIVVEALINNHFEIVEDHFDMAISIGGDGTFLKMVHALNFNKEIFYASINAGSLGFLSSIDCDNINYFITSIQNNSYIIKELNLLNMRVFNKDKVKNYLSLNEFTIRKNDFSTLKIDVFVNNQLLENFNGDGLVISTPVGSTAYNQALGGSIIDNDLSAFILTPIVPINNCVYQSLANPIILSDKNMLKLIPKNNDNLCVISDGMINNIAFDKIECQLFSDKIKCLMPHEYNYINTIKSKLVDNKE